MEETRTTPATTHRSTAVSVPHPFLRHPPATANTRRVGPGDGASIDLRSVPTYPVTNLDIDITEACNLACVYCFKSELYGQYMSLRTLRSCFDWLIAASRSEPSINFNFMGGEPTLRWKDIEAFAPWARRRAHQIGKSVSFSMTSNMTLWTPAIREFVDKYGFGVLMSIDGCPEVQDSQRPARNGKRVSETVEYWARSMLVTRPQSTARMTVHPSNVGRFEDSIRYLSDIGFREITVSASSYPDWTPANFDEMQRRLHAVVDTIVESFLSERPFNLTVFKYLINKLIRLRETNRPHEVTRIASPCGAGKGYMMIDYTGDIWPCHRFDGADTDAQAGGSYRLGNIFQSGFHTDLQQKFLEFDHSKIRKASCDQCPVDPVCGGYCPAANLQEAGNIYTPHDSYCAWSQLTYACAEALYRKSKTAGCLDRVISDCEGTDSDGR